MKNKNLWKLLTNSALALSVGFSSLSTTFAMDPERGKTATDLIHSNNARRELAHAQEPAHEPAQKPAPEPAPAKNPAPTSESNQGEPPRKKQKSSSESSAKKHAIQETLLKTSTPVLLRCPAHTSTSQPVPPPQPEPQRLVYGQPFYPAQPPAPQPINQQWLAQQPVPQQIPRTWHEHHTTMRSLQAQLCQLESGISTAKAQYKYRMLESIESYLTYIKGQISNNNNRADDIAVQLMRHYFQMVGSIECRYRIHNLDHSFYELSRPAIAGITDVINCLRDRSVTDEFRLAAARFLVAFAHSAANPDVVTVFDERNKTHFDECAGLVAALLKPQA